MPSVFLVKLLAPLRAQVTSGLGFLKKITSSRSVASPGAGHERAEFKFFFTSISWPGKNF